MISVDGRILVGILDGRSFRYRTIVFVFQDMSVLLRCLLRVIKDQVESKGMNVWISVFAEKCIRQETYSLSFASRDYICLRK